MLKKLLIAAVGALGLVAAGCEREEGQRPGGGAPSERDRQPTTPPPAPETPPETPPEQPPPTPPETPEERPPETPR